MILHLSILILGFTVFYFKEKIRKEQKRMIFSETNFGQEKLDKLRNKILLLTLIAIALVAIGAFGFWSEFAIF